MTDLSPSNASPSFANMAVISLQSDEIEDIWSTHVKRVMTDTSGSYAVNTFHLFARLFQVIFFSILQFTSFFSLIDITIVC